MWSHILSGNNHFVFGLIAEFNSFRLIFMECASFKSSESQSVGSPKGIVSEPKKNPAFAGFFFLKDGYTPKGVELS
jgi:hypothetical protein